jgi:CheY-like chemotaxis protein
MAPGSSIRAMTARICPRCGRNDVRQSGRRGIGDGLMALIGLAPYRCRACRNRFFRFPVGNGNGGVQPAADIPVQPISVQPISVQPVSVQPTASWPVAEEHPLAHVPIAYSILIVSRDPAIRKLLCKLLAEPAYHTHQLAETAQLPSELQARKVDLLITDLELPEQQGLETVAALRSKYPRLKIIALSGLCVAGAPGSIVLIKPFRREVLLESVQNALAEAADTRLPVI